VKIRKIISIAGIVLAASCATAADQKPADLLASQLQNYQTFSADFEQISRSQSATQPQQTLGNLKVAKPNLFRWHSDEPFPQEIVGDGVYVWIYDPDLEQATRKPFRFDANNAPALILNGQISQLVEQFDIALLEQSEAESLYQLKAKDENSSFQMIRLFFVDGLLTELMMEDSLEQRSTILFRNQQLNPEFAEETFRFALPDGADLIVDDGA